MAMVLSLCCPGPVTFIEKFKISNFIDNEVDGENGPQRIGGAC